MSFTLPQLMVTAAAREIDDGEVVFVGMRLPLLGFLLAKSTRAKNAVGIYELGIVRDALAPGPILTMGDLPNLYRAQWLADTADMMGLLQQGRVFTAVGALHLPGEQGLVQLLSNHGYDLAPLPLPLNGAVQGSTPPGPQ